MKEPKPVLKDGLYLGDNGRCFCFEHAGASAKYSGHDISGQKVLRVNEGKDDLGFFYTHKGPSNKGFRLYCEECVPISSYPDEIWEVGGLTDE